MSILARLTLEGLSVIRSLWQTYAHLGDTIELGYELTNDHSLGKLWLEVFEKSNWPEPLPGRVLSIGGHKTRKWKVLAKAHRRGRFRLGPIVLRSGDPFGLFATEARVPSEALLLVYPRVVQLPFCATWIFAGGQRAHGAALPSVDIDGHGHPRVPAR